jgi:hypothetical protein
MMRTCVAIAVLSALTLTAAVATSLAQNTAGDHEKGSTGWSGGSKDQPSQSAGTPGNPAAGAKAEVHDQAQAGAQPALASGKDLKGPPIQLPPSKTPE